MALQRGGCGEAPEGGQGGVGGWIWLRQWWPGRRAGWEAVHGEGRRWGAAGLGQGAGGAGGRGDGVGRCAGGVVGEQQWREAVCVFLGDVVGEHPQEHVRADPGFEAVVDRPDLHRSFMARNARSTCLSSL